MWLRFTYGLAHFIYGLNSPELPRASLDFKPGTNQKSTRTLYIYGLAHLIYGLILPNSPELLPEFTVWQAINKP